MKFFFPSRMPVVFNPAAPPPSFKPRFAGSNLLHVGAIHPRPDWIPRSFRFPPPQSKTTDHPPPTAYASKSMSGSQASFAKWQATLQNLPVGSAPLEPPRRAPPFRNPVQYNRGDRIPPDSFHTCSCFA